MDHIIEELKTIPGVTGGCIYNPKKGILANNLPSIFKDTKLISIGKLLQKIYNTGKMNFNDITEVTLHYEESILIVREAAENIYLVVFCDPSLNLNLVTMSMNLIMDDLSDLKETDIPAKSAAPAAAPAAGNKPAAAPVAASPVTPEQLLTQGPLARPLAGIQGVLVKVLGPMAKIIFMDSMKEWLKTGTPSVATIGNLINILSTELGDPTSVENFKKAIAPLFETKK